MTLFLKIVLGCIIAIGVVIGAAALVFWYFIQKLSKSCFQDDTTPLAIHLNEDLSPDWTESPQAAKLISEFIDLGFTQGLPYQVPEISDIRLLSFFHERYVGVVYHHPQLGHFFDVLHQDTSGHTVTVTTAPTGMELDSPPDKLKIHLTDAAVKEGVARLEEETIDSESMSHSNETFRDMLEQYYKEEQIYRNRNGGVSFDEFEKIAKNIGKRISEKKLQQSYLQFKQNELDQWSEAGIESYIEQNKIESEDLYSDGYFFIVPHKTDPVAFIHYLYDHDVVEDEYVEKAAKVVDQEGNILELFSTINQARSPELRAIHQGTITFPVSAEVYKLTA